MDTYAKGLIDKDVVEHNFTRDNRKRGKEYTLLYSHTRVRVQRSRHEGNEEEICGSAEEVQKKRRPRIQRKGKKDGGKGNIRLLKYSVI